METAYYTAEEAMKKLNKPRSTFFKEVENGLIPFELEPGRQRGRRFPKAAIDILESSYRYISKATASEIQAEGAYSSCFFAIQSG